MNYQILKSYFLDLGPKSEQIFNVNLKKLVLIPEENSKVFLHWTNNKGKLVTTLTLTEPTLIKNKVKLINGLDQKTRIAIVEI